MRYEPVVELTDTSNVWNSTQKMILSGVVLLVICWGNVSSACTTAVVSGRATVDGRPLLWKNRDTRSTQHNEVVLIEDGRYRVLAVVNAGSRSSVWMGVNSAGFCIENSQSSDLAIDEKTTGPGNGSFMKLALQTCATVEEFHELLELTNASGRTTTANFGVIDAQGGAALFETGPKSFTMFDANDPEVAPHGYVVRSNYATTAQGLSPNPTAAELQTLYSGERYLRACSLLEARPTEKIELRYVIRNMTRDLSDKSGRPYPGTVNGPSGDLPAVIDTSNTISRTTTVSAAVFQGVRPGEDPAFTTMWTLLGDPKFTLAVPCWVMVESVAQPLTHDRGAELGEIAITLREWMLTRDKTGIHTTQLPGIWEDLWSVEDQLFTLTEEALQAWRTNSDTPARLTELHHSAAERAMQAMQRELLELKTAAINAATPPPPNFDVRPLRRPPTPEPPVRSLPAKQLAP